jgi:uncharacterized delta-60 repeat protein
MSIIIKPVVSKGVPAVFTLDKTELAAHPLVLADPYFSNLTNWNRVRLVYISTIGSQSELLDFNATLSSPTATFLVTADSRDDFIVEKLVITDFDGGSLQIPRSSLVTGEFDLALGTGNYPALPATFIKAYSANVSSPQNIENARLNPNSYGFDINYSITKKMPVVDSDLRIISDFTDFNAVINFAKKQSDGKILLGGTFTNSKGFANFNRLIRLNSDGSLDVEFCNNASSNDKFNSEIHAIEIQSDGKILVGGSFQTYGGISGRSRLVRLNSDGTVDNAFCVNASDNNKFSSTVISVAQQSDGKILVGGDFTGYLVRLNSDGTSDADFIANASNGGKFTGNVITIALQTDNKILVGGGFTSYAGTSGRSGMIRLNSDGTVDNDFCVNASDNKNLNPAVFSIVVQPDGKILYGGQVYGSYNTAGFRRINSDGTMDSTFYDNTFNKLSPYDFIRRIVLLSNGKILLCGGFSNYGGASTRTYFVALNSDGTLDAPYTINSTDGLKFNSETRCALELSSGKVMVMGNFTNYSNFKYRNFVTVLNSNGTRDATLSDSVSSKSAKINSTVLTTAIQSDGKFLIGGTFTGYDTISGYNGLVRFNSDSTLDIDFCETIKSKFSTIRDIKIQPNGQILVAGDYTDYGGVPNRNRLVRLNIDGTLDDFFCSNASDGNKFIDRINSIAIQSDGKILIAGNFTSYNNFSNRNRLVRLNFDGTLDESFCINASDGNKFSGQIYCVEIQNDGKILVAGQFYNYNNIGGRGYFLRLNSDGTTDEAFCTNAVDSYTFNSETRNVKVQSNGKILIGGVFSGYKGSGRNHLIRLNSDGTLDTAFCANASNGGKIPAAATTIVLFKNYIIINLGYQSSYYNGNLRFLNQDGTTALTGIPDAAFNYIYLDTLMNAGSNEQLALIPTAYISEGRFYSGVIGVEMGDSNYSNAITYLSVDGLPSTELGPTGVSLSATPSGQLQYTNDDIEGIITLNASLKPTP